jgi:hypothetical protein
VKLSKYIRSVDETASGRTLSCLLGELRREDNIIFDEQIAMRGWTLEKWHALALDSLYEPGLRDALAHQRDDVSVQVSKVMCEAE